METRFFHAEEGKRAIAGELQTEAIFSGILEKGIASAGFAMPDPLLVAAAIKALLQDWYLKRWKYRRRNISVEAYGDFVISMVRAYGAGQTTKGEK
jgi:TetR/AcrR family transcriptional regulator, cholesterol catabolism regulator